MSEIKYKVKQKYYIEMLPLVWEKMLSIHYNSVTMLL